VENTKVFIRSLYPEDMKKLALMFVGIMILSGFSAQDTVVTITYYLVDGCPYCETVTSLMDSIEEEYTDVQVLRLNVYKSSVYMDEFLSYGFWKVPAIVINEKAIFQGEEITEERTIGIVEKYRTAYTQGSSFFETGRGHYEKKEYKKAQVYLDEAKKLFTIGNFDVNATVQMLQDCNACVVAADLIFSGDLFLESGDKEKARDMYSQVSCGDLDDTAESRIKNIEAYDGAVQVFEQAVTYYADKRYTEACELFGSVAEILVGETGGQCSTYTEWCEKRREADRLCTEAVTEGFTDLRSAQKKLTEAGIIYASVGESSERCDTFIRAFINFQIGKTLYEADPESALLYFEEAKRDFNQVAFQEGVEKCNPYIEKPIKNNNPFLYLIPLSAIAIVFIISLYIFYFQKKDKKDYKKKNNNNKTNKKKELKELVDKYANGEMSIEEFEKKKKKVIK
jgi:glutaredoxin